MKSLSGHTARTLGYVVYCLVLLPGCSTSYKRIKPDVQHRQVSTSVKERMHLEDSCQEAYDALRIEEQLLTGMSRSASAHIVLNNQFTTKTVLEELGMSQTDLTQAGIYKNPFMQNTFDATPLNQPSGIPVEISCEIDFSISDLWQLPKRKKVAQKDVAIKQLEVTSTIIDAIIQVQYTYDVCLALQEKIEHARESVRLIEHLFKDARRSKDPTIGEQATLHTVEASCNGWHLVLIAYEQQLALQYIALRDALSVQPSSNPCVLTSQLVYEPTKLVDCEILEEAALENSYELALTAAKIEKGRAAINLEHSRFLDNFSVGYIFEKETPDTLASGFAVYLDLPIFDNNRAGIARARFALTKAQKEYSMTKRTILAKVHRLYTQLQTLHASIPLYQESIKHYNNGLGVAGTLPTMEIVYMLAVPSIYQSIFDTHVLLLDAYVQARDAVRQLEALTGCSVYESQEAQLDSAVINPESTLTLKDLNIAVAHCNT